MDIEPPSILLLALDYSHAVSLAVIVLLLFCSALISGSEVAFFSLTANDIEDELEKGSKKMELVSGLLDKPKKLLATILVSNNFCLLYTSDAADE